MADLTDDCFELIDADEHWMLAIHADNVFLTPTLIGGCCVSIGLKEGKPYTLVSHDKKVVLEKLKKGLKVKTEDKLRSYARLAGFDYDAFVRMVKVN